MQNSHHPLNSGASFTASNVRISCGLINSAGDVATEVAALFSFPHFEFLALPPARMHLVGLAIAGIGSDDLDVDQLNSKKFCNAASVLADPCPVGLEGILDSLTFPLWTPSSYRVLWGLLHCARAKKLLAHASSIDPLLVTILDELPPALRETKVVGHLRRPMEATVLARIANNDIQAGKLLRVLRHSENRAHFFEKVIEFVEKATMVPIPPQIDHPLIRPILDIHHLSRTALSFRNCMRGSIDDVLSGEVAFYVVDGAEPAVFSMEPRIGGYVITQIRGMQNALVGQETKDLVRKAMGDSGITLLKDTPRHSKIKWNLERLGSADDDDFRTIDAECHQFLETGYGVSERW